MNKIGNVDTFFIFFFKFILKSRFLSLANFNRPKLIMMDNSWFKFRTNEEKLASKHDT